MKDPVTISITVPLYQEDNMKDPVTISITVLQLRDACNSTPIPTIDPDEDGSNGDVVAPDDFDGEGSELDEDRLLWAGV